MTEAPAPTTSPPTDEPYRRETPAPPALSLWGYLLRALLTPWRTLRHPDARLRVVGPFLWVVGAGVLYGLLYLSMVDVEALVAAELASQALSAEQLEQAQRFGGLFAKLQAVLGTLFASGVWVVVGGGLIFATSRAFAREQVPSLIACVSLAVYTLAPELLRTGACAVGLLLGNPTPSTSLAFVVPSKWAGLGYRLDPFVVWSYVLLAAAIGGQSRLRVGAWVVAGGLYGTGFVFGVLGALNQ